MDFAATVIDLAHRAGLPLLTQLAVLFGLAVVVYVCGRLGLKLPVLPGDPTQTDARDDANPRKDKPDAQWGTNDGPPGGGMEGG